jgi:hypothetical protein
MKRHPEDLIFEKKKFITELSNVQEIYLSILVEDLGLNKEGEEWLFDYVYNSSEDEYDDFGDYLEKHGQKYENFVN